jgi:hypothetical protein
MSDVIPVSVEWLTLREDADARARSSQLARTAARMSQAPIVVHDLGSGTGSMMRWLAPMLPGPQTWVLHDWNSALLDHAAERALDSTGHDTAVRTSVKDVAHLRAGDLAGGSLVTMSALLDVLSLEEAHAVVSACIAAGVPALFTLSVTGEVMLDPVDPGDRMFESAFNDHQRRTVDGRRLLGPDAVTMVVELFRAAGWSVMVEESPWELDAADPHLIEEWLEGWLGAAVEERPALQEWAEEYQQTRLAQLRGGALTVVVQHQDVFAWRP